MRFRFLGTGTSVGVPQIGCSCKVCTSKDPRDRRRRCGAYVTSGNVGFLIDTPPEMRLACVEYGISKVDAVVLTHAHMDHVAGFDDVRRFNTLNGTMVACDPNAPGANGRTCRCVGKIMPCYAMPETEEAMHRIFPYISTKGGEHGLYRPQIEFRNEDVFEIGSMRVERVVVGHGFPCCGYLISSDSSCSSSSSDSSDSSSSSDSSCSSSSSDSSDSSSPSSPSGSRDSTESRDSSDPSDSSDSRASGDARSARLAYVSDCHEIPDASLARLQGVDTLVINCLREREHPTHLKLSAALDYIEKIAPRRAYLIHMCHDFTHEEWLAKLPKGVEPAYDGLEIEV